MEGIQCKSCARFDPRTIGRIEFWRMTEAVQDTAPANYYVTITSGCDGKHKTDSKHYTGWAKDYRIKDVPGVKIAQLGEDYVCLEGKEILNLWEKRIKRRLGDQYFVAIEYEKVHLHVQYNGG